jgi:hypothetical protein
MAFVRRNRGAGRQKRKSWHSQGGTKRQHESQSKVRFGSGTFSTICRFCPNIPKSRFRTFLPSRQSTLQQILFPHISQYLKNQANPPLSGIGPQILHEADHGIASPVEKFTKKSGKNSFMDTISISS